MPAIIANANKFLLNSDYPTDKVIYLQEFNTGTISASSFSDITINHPLGFAPLLQSQFTTDNSWAFSYDENAGPVFPNGQFYYQTAVESYSDKIIIRNTNNTANPVVLYWRIYGFMPSNVNVDVSSTANTADNFALNSDYNHTKLYKSGVTASSSITGSTEIIAHNLGYRPQVLAWGESSGSYTYYMGVYTQDGSSGNNNLCQVDTSSITFKRDSLFLTSAIKFHYRIYLEAQ